MRREASLRGPVVAFWQGGMICEGVEGYPTKRGMTLILELNNASWVFMELWLHPAERGEI